MEKAPEIHFTTRFITFGTRDWDADSDALMARRLINRVGCLTTTYSGIIIYTAVISQFTNEVAGFSSVNANSADKTKVGPHCTSRRERSF